MARPRFQIMSDLHLETPLIQPSYQKFDANVNAEYLCLLGDIGLVKDPGLFWFLENLLRCYHSLKIFYVLGNHEAYHTSLENAHAIMRNFEGKMSRKYGRRFFVMNRTRHDIDPDITVLGCTLWSHITDDQTREVWKTLTDFKDNGIRDRDVNGHREDHQEDLDWLNKEVSRIEEEEPDRQIIILTHHSPTIDQRINNPEHKNSKVRSGFVTDLSQEMCWKSKNVRCWAFGHTHYSGSYHEDGTNKLVYSNQRGYSSLGAAEQPVVSGQAVTTGEIWQVTDCAAPSTMRAPPTPRQSRPAVSKPVQPEPQRVEQKKRVGIMRRLLQCFG